MERRQADPMSTPDPMETPDQSKGGPIELKYLLIPAFICHKPDSVRMQFFYFCGGRTTSFANRLTGF